MLVLDFGRSISNPIVNSLNITSNYQNLFTHKKCFSIYLLIQEAEAFQSLLESDTCKSLVHFFFAQRGTTKVKI